MGTREQQRGQWGLLLERPWEEGTRCTEYWLSKYRRHNLLQIVAALKHLALVGPALVSLNCVI